MTTLFIIDSHLSIRQALGQRLSYVPGIDVIGTAGGSRDGVAQVRAAHPDVVLLELKLADGGGMETLRAILAERPSPRVIVLTSYLDDVERQAALKAGAEQYLLKDIGSERLAEEIVGPPGNEVTRIG